MAPFTNSVTRAAPRLCPRSPRRAAKLAATATSTQEERNLLKQSTLALRRPASSCSRSAPAAAPRSTTTKAGDSLKGAGSTFVSPLVSTWLSPTKRRPACTSTTTRSARAGGSRRSQNRPVDFGASDAPLTPDQFKACNGCVQIPWALSATSVVVQPAGRAAAPEDHGPVLANIFLGNVTKWNDAGDQEAQPGRQPSRHRRSRRSSARTAAGRRTTSRTTCRASALRSSRRSASARRSASRPASAARGSAGVSAVLARTTAGSPTSTSRSPCGTTSASSA